MGIETCAKTGRGRRKGVHWKLFRALPLLLVLPAAHVARSAPPAGAAELLQFLGLVGRDHLLRLERGGVVHSGLLTGEPMPEEVAAVGAMLLVDAVDRTAVTEAFLHSETFRQVHELTRHELLARGPLAPAAFAKLSYPGPSRPATIIGDPPRHLNLSGSEAETFRKLAGQRGDMAALVTQALASVMAGRANRFAAAGVAGIAPYARARGATVRPAAELENAIRSLAMFADEYPGFLSDLRGSGVPDRGSRRFHWLQAPFQGASVLALSTDLRRDYGDRAIAADMHFYATSGYNSMLTIVGVAPYQKRWLVFAINFTFTDQVLGFGSGIKRSVARKAIAERLAKHLETVRRKLK